MTKLTAYMTMREAAATLGVSTQRVHQLVTEGKLDAKRIENRITGTVRLEVRRKEVMARKSSLASPDLRNGQ